MNRNLEDIVVESSGCARRGVSFLSLFFLAGLGFFAISGVVLYASQAALMHSVFEQLQTELEEASASFAVDSFELPEFSAPSIEFSSVPETIEVGP